MFNSFFVCLPEGNAGRRSKFAEYNSITYQKLWFFDSVMGCHQCWETMWPISWWPEPYGPWPHPMYVMFQSRSCGIYMIHDGDLLWFGIICGIYGTIWYLVWYFLCCKHIWTFDGVIPFWLVIPKKMSNSFLKSKGLHFFPYNFTKVYYWI